MRSTKPSSESANAYSDHAASWLSEATGVFLALAFSFAGDGTTQRSPPVVLPMQKTSLRGR
jgi:hypothetical protein